MKQVFDAESSEIWGYCILKGAEIETIVLSFWGGKILLCNPCGPETHNPVSLPKCWD